MKLIKTTIFSGLTTLVKISTGFVSTKIVAILIGAPGVAVMGAFVNFLAIVLTFGNGAINTGVVKYTAEYLDNEQQTKKLFSTSLRISFFCSFFIGVFLTIFSNSLSQLIFADNSYKFVIITLGVTLLFYSLNSLLVSILNGKGQIKILTLVNTLGSIIGLFITLTLVYFYKIHGALYALILSQTLVFFVSLTIVFRQPWMTVELFKQKIDYSIVRKLSSYTSMAIVTALTIPVSQLFLRNIIIEKLNITDAGIWQGMMRVSDGYLMIINMALLTYYLPKLSSIKLKSELRKEIFQGYKMILPAVMVMSFTMYLGRYFIIDLLYTADFYPMEKLFFWQLLGDVFKIASYILAYLMLAKAMMKIYIITEIMFSISYVLFSYWFVGLYGVEGAAMGFCLNYLLYLLLFIIIFRKLLFYGK
ncbi:O-antigen translocase [Flavobacterium sp. HSC-61S13]|uniref:O-antigen translocase n=1 Tax=Flavobacterium sp. HSC-61S13 TaxID=2910963 RepID=UPI00209F5A11|nr:O-antigen translocase [Flavobacterium sp. HSC-61S13]MCP1997425.1 PST family polysaccharide transporter [Flavobacterium sp. HSC-61S13]